MHASNTHSATVVFQLPLSAQVIKNTGCQPLCLCHLTVPLSSPLDFHLAFQSGQKQIIILSLPLSPSSLHRIQRHHHHHRHHANHRPLLPFASSPPPPPGLAINHHIVKYTHLPSESLHHLNRRSAHLLVVVAGCARPPVPVHLKLPQPTADENPYQKPVSTSQPFYSFSFRTQ